MLIAQSSCDNECPRYGGTTHLLEIIHAFIPIRELELELELEAGKTSKLAKISS